MLSTFYNNNKTLNNNRYKTIDTQKRNKSNLFSLFSNKDKKKFSIFPKQMSRNDEEKDMPIFNSFNIYNSLSTSSKIKNQIHMITISQDSKYNSNNDNNNANFKINNIKSVIFGKETQKSNDLSFPKLSKNNLTKNKKKILMRKIQKQNKFNSMDKCLYDTGDFQIPFVTLSDSKNIKKMKNLTYYAELKKLILDKKLLC